MQESTIRYLTQAINMLLLAFSNQQLIGNNMKHVEQKAVFTALEDVPSFNVIIGFGNEVNHSNCLVIGHGNSTSRDGQVIIGNEEVTISGNISDEKLECIRSTLSGVLGAGGVRMTSERFEKIVQYKFPALSEETVAACKEVILEGASAYSAEKRNNCKKSTVSRYVNKIVSEFEYCLSVTVVQM